MAATTSFGGDSLTRNSLFVDVRGPPNGIVAGFSTGPTLASISLLSKLSRMFLTLTEGASSVDMQIIGLLARIALDCKFAADSAAMLRAASALCKDEYPLSSPWGWRFVVSSMEALALDTVSMVSPAAPPSSLAAAAAAAAATPPSAPPPPSPDANLFLLTELSRLCRILLACSEMKT